MMKQFIFVFILFLLAGCSSKQNYAPVRSYQRDLIPGEKYYIVQKGDTLYSIGFRSDLGYQNLSIWNKIPAPYKLNIGQRLKLFKNNKTGSNSHKKIKEKRYTSQKKSHKLKKKRNRSQKNLENSTANKKVLKLFWQWPIKKKILKTFSQTGNKGIDISGKLGQKVRTASAGKVVYSGSALKGYGNLLIIKHNDFYLSAYANNRRLFVKEGQWVKKGHIIAEVGLVGGKKASLHFEIRKNGKPVNPLKYLPK